MNLSIGKDWEAVNTTTTGSGNVVVTNGVLATSSVEGDNAKATKHIFCNAGDKITVTCMARKVSGVGSIGGIAINQNGVTKSRAYTTLNDWHEVSCTHSVPLNIAYPSQITIDFGVFTSESGGIEYADPRVKIESTTVGGMRCIAAGLIAVSAGTPSINAGFTNFGITSLSYDAPSMSLSLEVPRTSGAASTSPIFMVQVNGGGSGATALMAKQVGFSAATGVVLVKFVDMTTGAFVDITSIPSMFIFFKAEVI